MTDKPTLPTWVKTPKDLNKWASEKAKAAQIWRDMDANAKCGVRFGMFPAELMRKAEAEGFDQHKLVCALMDCAKADGGMRA